MLRARAAAGYATVRHTDVLALPLTRRANVLRTSDVIAFASSTDLGRARSFYEDVLGLKLAEQSPYACVIDADGTMLRITAAAGIAHPGYTVLGWQVADIRHNVDQLE